MSTNKNYLFRIWCYYLKLKMTNNNRDESNKYNK